jgi:hypothetical protein
LCVRSNGLGRDGLGREGGRESDVRCWLGGWLGGWVRSGAVRDCGGAGNIVGACGKMHCDGACWARVGHAAAATTRKAGNVEWEGVLKACCICILDDREAVGREALEAGRDVPGIGSRRAINSS